MNKTLSKLGFLKHACKDIHDEHVLKLLYFTLFYPLLKYGHLILPSNFIIQNHISKMQNNFLLFLCFQCNMFRKPHLNSLIITAVVFFYPFLI